MYFNTRTLLLPKILKALKDEFEGECPVKIQIENLSEESKAYLKEVLQKNGWQANFNFCDASHEKMVLTIKPSKAPFTR